MRCICTSTSLKGTVIPSNVNIERAFEAERAIKLYGEMLHSLALSRCKSKEDAEDVCQEVLIALLNRKEPFKNNEHMKAWLIRAALHRSKNTHRYENRHPRTPYDPALHDRPEQDSTTDCEKLHDAVESLSEELKETLRLYYRDIAMQVVGVGFVIGVIQDSVETALNSLSDALFTATADYKERREAGVPFQVGKDADEWKPSTAE